MLIVIFYFSVLANMSTSRQVFNTLEEAVDYYLYSKQIEANPVALPTKVDDNTNEEVTNDEDLDVPVVLDVAGQLEIDLPSDDDDIPLSSCARRAPSTSHQLKSNSLADRKITCEENINDEDPDVPVGERI